MESTPFRLVQGFQVSFALTHENRKLLNRIALLLQVSMQLGCVNKVSGLIRQRSNLRNVTASSLDVQKVGESGNIFHLHQEIMFLGLLGLQGNCRYFTQNVV